MTKENRELAYKHFREQEKNYEALPHLNSGLTATEFMRNKCKKVADALLIRNPELEVKPVEEVKQKSNSKGV